MTQELTIAEQQAIQVQIEALGGLAVAGDENLEQGDVGMPPRLRISQPNRPIKIGDADASAGAFVNTVTNEVFSDGIEIVPLVFLPKTRVMWPAQFNADNDPLCASDNGQDPATSGDQRKLTNPQRGPCVQCPSSKFSASGDKPACMAQRNFLVWLVEGSEPAILTMQSTALSSARSLTTLAKTQGLTKTVMLITQKQEDGRGTWYVPAVTRGRRLEGASLLSVLEARNELRNLVISADVDLGAVEDTNPHGGAPGENPVDGGPLDFGPPASAVGADIPF